MFQSLIQSAFYVFHFEFLSSFDQIFLKNTLFLQCHLQKFIKIQKIVNFDLLAKLISFNPGHKSSKPAKSALPKNRVQERAAVKALLEGTVPKTPRKPKLLSA